jgi:hypothetical protein
LSIPNVTFEVAQQAYVGIHHSEAGYGSALDTNLQKGRRYTTHEERPYIQAVIHGAKGKADGVVGFVVYPSGAACYTEAGATLLPLLRLWNEHPALVCDTLMKATHCNAILASSYSGAQQPVASTPQAVQLGSGEIVHCSREVLLSFPVINEMYSSVSLKEDEPVPLPMLQSSLALDVFDTFYSNGYLEITALPDRLVPAVVEMLDYLGWPAEKFDWHRSLRDKLHHTVQYARLMAY